MSRPPPHPQSRRGRGLLRLFAAAVLAPSVLADAFRERLTLDPLPDGKLSVLFEFRTDFSSHSASASASSHTRAIASASSSSHHSLTPPSLLLPLAQNNVSELSISFISGQWDAQRSARAGPLRAGAAGGGGGEVRGWLARGAGYGAWEAVTHALGGLFCATLGPEHEGDTVRTFGHVYPPSHEDGNEDAELDLEHYALFHPNQQLCTENLTPFLALLPSKGVSGLAALLAQPGVVLGWGFKSEGIRVTMPRRGAGADVDGVWEGWWEGVLDLVPRGKATRDFSLTEIFGRALPVPFPEADESVLRVLGDVHADPPSHRAGEWDLEEMAGKDIRFTFNEGEFVHPSSFPPPPISISRRIISPHAGDGILVITIHNALPITRTATFSQVWPWWIKGWMSEMTTSPSSALSHVAYHPSRPPTPSTTSLHLSLKLMGNSTTEVRIPYTKLTLKYTEHRPDAERGVDIPAGVLSLDALPLPPPGKGEGERGWEDGGIEYIYTPRLLLDVPTPDFSMPYNVIIMSSTVMAVFFGLMQGALTRRWGVVQVKKAKQK